MRLSSCLVLQQGGPTSDPEERQRREEPSHGKGHANGVRHVGNPAPSLSDSSEVDDRETAGTSSLRVTRKTPPHRGRSRPEHYSHKDTVLQPRDDQAHFANHAGLTGLPNQLRARVPGHPPAALRTELSGNIISSTAHDALYLLLALRDLILLENQLAALPMLPHSLELLDVRLNQLELGDTAWGFQGEWGLQPALCHLPHPYPQHSQVSLPHPCSGALEKLRFLYLADILLDSIPGPRPLTLCLLHLQWSVVEA
ncbi:Opticin [Fukomys damarensis]|uniref:Opticin n=1 Tax=Fukomys damarensis TaxID=885580 RepID=A0A091DNK0_FUKDA|nr:Opticin [Fukomys damarensis]